MYHFTKKILNEIYYIFWTLRVTCKYFTKKKKIAKCLDYCNLSEIYEISLLHIENGAYIFYVFMHQSLDWKHIFKARVSWNDFCKIRLINNLQSSINCNWKHIYNATVSWNDICKIRLIHNLQSWNIWGWKHAYNATVTSMSAASMCHLLQFIFKVKNGKPMAVWVT